jgi:hypothetical protein
MVFHLWQPDELHRIVSLMMERTLIISLYWTWGFLDVSFDGICGLRCIDHVAQDVEEFKIEDTENYEHNRHKANDKLIKCHGLRNQEYLNSKQMYSIV